MTASIFALRKVFIEKMRKKMHHFRGSTEYQHFLRLKRTLTAVRVEIYIYYDSHIIFTYFCPYSSVFYPCYNFWWFHELVCKTHRCQCGHYLYASWIHLHILTILLFHNGKLNERQSEREKNIEWSINNETLKMLYEKCHERIKTYFYSTNINTDWGRESKNPLSE